MIDTSLNVLSGSHAMGIAHSGFCATMSNRGEKLMDIIEAGRVVKLELPEVDED